MSWFPLTKLQDQNQVGSGEGCPGIFIAKPLPDAQGVLRILSFPCAIIAFGRGLRSCSLLMYDVAAFEFIGG
jgi:hypothetical protein